MGDGVSEQLCCQAVAEVAPDFCGATPAAGVFESSER